MPKNTPSPSINKLIVTADSLNVRRTPSLEGQIAGSLNNGDVVDWLGTSDDKYWQRIRRGSLAGWSSHKYLRPQLVNAPAPDEGWPWLPIAYAELGVKEVAGSADNPRVVEYLHSTNLDDLYANNDETPWCSAFVNWCVERAGYAGTDSAAAISWGNWGRSSSSPAPGDIVVFNHGNGHGHVGFYIGVAGNSVKVLGGNQSNEVRISNYSRNAVWRIRKPL